MVELSLVYVYYNTPKEIIDSLKSVKEAVGQTKAEIIIVDNASDLPIPNQVKEYHVIVIKNKQNVGYGGAANIGVKTAKGKYILVSNPDLIFLPNSIKEMVTRIDKDPDIGIVGPAFLNSRLIITNVGSGYPFFPDIVFAFSSLNKIFPNNFFSKRYYLDDFDRKFERELPVICGACMLIKKNVFEKVDGFDECFFMYFEESDLCLRIHKLGYKILYFPKARVVHYVARSNNDRTLMRKMFEKSRYIFVQKHQGTVIAVLSELLLRLNRIVSPKGINI